MSKTNKATKKAKRIVHFPAKLHTAQLAYANWETVGGSLLMFHAAHGWYGGQRVMAAAIIGHGA